MTGWYSARVLFESRIDGVALSGAILEESVRVLKAKDEAEARARAEEVARGAEHGYANEQGQTVSWHLVAVLDVQDLCETEIQDGTEVFSRMFRRDSADAAARGADDEPAP